MELLCVIIIAYLAYQIYAFLYFRSKQFLKIKDSIEDHIKNCNELNHHIEDLKGTYVGIKSYDYGQGVLRDESVYNFKRKEWKKMLSANHILN